MKHLVAVFWAILFVDLFALAIFVLASVGNERAGLASITPFLVLAGVSVAVLTLVAKQSRDRSEDYLKSATELMEKAYAILDDNRSKDELPSNSRRDWFTSARLVTTAQRLADHIEEESHKRVWEIIRLYWRAQFREMLFPDGEGLPGTYFAGSAEKMRTWFDEDRAPVDQRAIAVLFRFTEWSETDEDPIKNEEYPTNDEIDHMYKFGPYGLGRLLKEVQEIEVRNRAKYAQGKAD